MRDFSEVTHSFSDFCSVSCGCIRGDFVCFFHPKVLLLQKKEMSFLELPKLSIFPDGVYVIGIPTEKCVENGEIGISSKKNHSAIEHARLSQSTDFGKEWTGFPRDKSYFEAIESTFKQLNSFCGQNLLLAKNWLHWQKGAKTQCRCEFVLFR
jgi:hypothetical protein